MVLLFLPIFLERAPGGPTAVGVIKIKEHFLILYRREEFKMFIQRFYLNSVAYYSKEKSFKA